MAWLAVAFVVYPPTHWRWQFGLLFGLGLWALIQCFFPFVGSPSYLDTLLSAGLPSPKAVAVQPLVSLETLPLLWCGLLGAYWFLGRRYPDDYAKYLLRGFCGLFAGASAIAAVCLASGTLHPAFEDVGFFSFFANRNQSATLYALSAVTSFGLFFIERNRQWKLYSLAFAAVSIVALALSPSRGGWISAGVGIIVVLLGTRQKFLWITLACVGMALVILFASPKAVERPSGASTSQEFRPTYYLNTLSMFADNPLGVGLANFRYIFPHYQRVTALDTIAGHPENDWLWLLSEAGFPALALLIAALSFRLNYDNRRHRVVAAIIIATALPSLWDVPLHRLGLVFPLLAVAGPMLIAPKEPLRNSRRILLSLLCVVLLALNYFLYSSLYRSIVRFKTSFAIQRLDLVRKTTSELTRVTPYDYWIYQNSYRGETGYDGSGEAALSLTKKALATHPKLPQLALYAGYDWQEFDKPYALRLYAEALRRAEALERPLIFRGILMRLNRDDLADAARLCSRDASLWNMLLTREDALSLIPLALQKGIELHKLADKNLLYANWVLNPATASAALEYLQANDKTSLYIPLAHATLGDPRSATIAFFALQGPKPLPDTFPYLTTDELRLQARLQRASAPPYLLALAARAQKAGDLSMLETLLAELTSLPNCPPEGRYAFAKLLSERDDWQGAFEQIRALILKK